MKGCRIDHITIASPCLAQGIEWVRETLGVTPQPGGEHPRMGTHNALLRLGDSIFLEVISPNPDAAPPQRPRWFELDRLEPGSAPRLSNWVARTTDILASAEAASEPLGAIEPMSRGALEWLITIPADGSLPFAGIAPALIEWHTDAHVAARLDDKGCSLLKLEAFHPQAARVSRLIHSLGLVGEFSVTDLPPGTSPYLVAHIRTPRGPALIGSR